MPSESEVSTTLLAETLSGGDGHNNDVAYCDRIIVSTRAIIHFVASSALVGSEQVCQGASTATATEDTDTDTPRPKSGAGAYGVGLKFQCALYRVGSNPSDGTEQYKFRLRGSNTRAGISRF